MIYTLIDVNDVTIYEGDLAGLRAWASTADMTRRWGEEDPMLYVARRGEPQYARVELEPEDTQEVLRDLLAL